ncbi:hypothetical protein [Pseudooceanicola spongiae]|nr:hypothetical protein [Pseudooceanicola spongiae]|tara:strand:+ start:334 stop:477 length:144 start_codon:yes stop_codon:yes gene_type:complete
MFIPQGRRSIASLFVIALFTLAGLSDYISAQVPAQQVPAQGAASEHP